MATIEMLQNELIRDVLNINDINILKKIRNFLRKEEHETAEQPVVSEDEVPYMSKAEILSNFDQACKELKLNLEGKLEFKTAEELLDEL